MNEFRTKFHALQNDLKRLREELHKYQQAARNQAERIRELEAENADLKKIRPSVKDVMELYTRFICANIIERERLAVQIASRMPEVCMGIHNLENENADLRNQLRDALERC